jgi:hypothetical protein
MAMKLELIRTYYLLGTNGKILIGDQLLAFSIELPWKDNCARVSCIPEGEYELSKRYSLHFAWHLQVMNVPGRTNILIHPANNAMLELKGCIAPVSMLTGAGRGLRSREALQLLTSLVFGALDRKEQVYLIIKTDQYEST